MHLVHKRRRHCLYGTRPVRRLSSPLVTSSSEPLFTRLTENWTLSSGLASAGIWKLSPNCVMEQERQASHSTTRGKNMPGVGASSFGGVGVGASALGRTAAQSAHVQSVPAASGSTLRPRSGFPAFARWPTGMEADGRAVWRWPIHAGRSLLGWAMGNDPSLFKDPKTDLAEWKAAEHQ